jgi:hypothetical protein
MMKSKSAIILMLFIIDAEPVPRRRFNCAAFCAETSQHQHKIFDDEKREPNSIVTSSDMA